MGTLAKTLAFSIRPMLASTAILERFFREFLDAAKGGLNQAELELYYSIPDALGVLGVSGAVVAVRLAAGEDALAIDLSFDPDVEEDFELDRLVLCELSARPIVVGLVVGDPVGAEALGMDRLTGASLPNLRVQSLAPGTEGRRPNAEATRAVTRVEVW